ncbi:MAG: GNAT family N-acetyltransferase [Brachybacterium sp.]|uniref:GNAT family N-acetyltransferase n=1 Tax=Brachybacterium sp. TaxID=1891286 RepID=UPI00264996DE|nr:GNAT family N-acetyltransferase [Brachybacterium sp.]MDN5687365.1 GNAT family N-acetyltransferase [Brachybacterium sp.]
MPNPRIRVRDATSEDADALTNLAIQVQTLHAEGRPDLFRPAHEGALRDFLIDRLAAGVIVLIAEADDGRALGYLLADVASRPESPFLCPHTSLYVHHIAVDQDARRQHVGALLMAEILDRAQQASADTIRLDSWSFNEEAHRFFEAQGFAASRVIFERPIGTTG